MAGRTKSQPRPPSVQNPMCRAGLGVLSAPAHPSARVSGSVFSNTLALAATPSPELPWASRQVGPPSVLHSSAATLVPLGAF